MRLLETHHPFFRPLWRRVLLTIAPFAWAFFELSQDNTIWAYLFAGIGGFLCYHFLIAYKPPED